MSPRPCPGVDDGEFSAASSTQPFTGANASSESASRKRAFSHSAHHPQALALAPAPSPLPLASSSLHPHPHPTDFARPQKDRRRRSKTDGGVEVAGGRSKSQAELVGALPPGLLITPYPTTAPASSSYLQAPLSQSKRAASSPQFVRPRSGSSSSATVVVEPTPAPSLSIRSPTSTSTRMDDSSDDDDEREDGTIYLARPATRSFGQTSHLRPRKVNVAAVNRWREDQLAAEADAFRGPPFTGETETELEDEVPQNESLIPVLIEFLVPYLFEATRWLSVVPAVIGTLYNMHNIIHPPPSHNVTSIDYAISALWSTLTGFQCLALTTGLLLRWKVYYATLSTLIRLVALQAICWPATHFTLVLFNHTRRPIVCWAIIGSTTCFSRSVQLWVTSNILVGRNSRGEGRLGPRRWDWGEVGRRCVLPAGFLYFITTWLLLLKGELIGIR